MNDVARILHDATHLVPGVPAHDDDRPALSAQRSRQAHAAGHRPHHERIERHQRPPRVLVAWQNRIARLVHADRA